MSEAKRYYDLIAVAPKGYIPQVGSHRYLLHFKTKKPLGGKSAAVIQMNGSKAGPKKVGTKKWQCDSTIGKVLCWCYRNQFETVICLNLFSYVDQNPENLIHLDESQLNSPDNDQFIKNACSQVDYVIIAHGDCEGIDPIIVKRRINNVNQLLMKYNLYRVGDLTKNENPRHGRSWNNNPRLILHRKKLKSDIKDLV